MTVLASEDRAYLCEGIHKILASVVSFFGSASQWIKDRPYGFDKVHGGGWGKCMIELSANTLRLILESIYLNS